MGTWTSSEFWDQVLALANRRRQGYMSCCLTVDLLGVKSILARDPHEAGVRLNRLQQGFADATLLFPGADKYRACFLGDSWFVVREIPPEESLSSVWPIFCGHVYALTSVVQDLERQIGNPGTRAVASYGQLVQLEAPDGWRHEYIENDTKHWFVLTGADEALIKSERAQRVGKAGGFVGGHFWFESIEQPNLFMGSPFGGVAIHEYRQPELYSVFYKRICRGYTKSAILDFLGEEHA